jgi:hypothetical protein
VDEKGKEVKNRLREGKNKGQLSNEQNPSLRPVAHLFCSPESSLLLGRFFWQVGASADSGRGRKKGRL